MSVLKDHLFLATLAVLIVLVLVVLGIVLYFALRRSEAKPGTDPKTVKLRFDSLRGSFRQAVELIEANIVSRSERYSIPWVLVLNEDPASQKQLPIEQSGVASALSTESASAAATQGISWHFFDKGIVIDMQGAYLGSPDDEDSAERPWDEFLGLCRNYRPQRPFDSLVITVPARLLLDKGADAKLELVKLARIAHRRLWLAQNRFAMRFAVYVAISECERIEGFSSFARALPDTMRAGMLGWSSPYDLSTTYQSEWVQEAMDSVLKATNDACAEMFAVDSSQVQASQFFLLPSRIRALEEQLQAYMDELMRPSAYHEPFFFRGIYLTGDCSESADVASRLEQLAEEPVATPGEPALDAVSQLMREPAFLRDLFEKKIFLEYGIARPSKQQLARPALSLAARWTAGLVLGGWCLGIVIASYQLERRNGDLVKTLWQIEQDANYRARAAERGERIPSSWYRAKTLALLAEIEKLGVDRAWTFFMPGSWRIFEDLDARVAERIEREFGEIAIKTLRRELYTRAAELTGVPQDDSTSELIMGAECAAPAGFSALAGTPGKPTLALEDLPEFSALQQYLGNLDRLDQAMQAMMRLQKTSLSANDDLKLLVKYTLGADLPGNISQSLRFFKDDEKSGRMSPASINVRHIHQAVQCSLNEGFKAINRRLFVNNDLLVSERQIANLSTTLFTTDVRSRDFSQTVAGFKAVLASIREQESLLASGKGGWMRLPNLALGPAYDAILNRIQQSTQLLGPEVADAIRREASVEFERLSAEYQSHFGVEERSGVVWREKDSRFGLSDQRLALRDALIALMSQPFMISPSQRRISDVSGGGALQWDVAKLDQATKLTEALKSYTSEGINKFAPAYRSGVAAFVNQQFTRLLSDQVLDALTLAERPDATTAGDAQSFEAARSRLTKIQLVFSEMGATADAESLKLLVSRDALQRLRQVDAKLNQLDLYAIRGQDFRAWTGEKGPLLQAFGVVDGAGLQQYLGVQYGRVEALGRQAEIYLSAMSPNAADMPEARRWQSINRELERYRLKNPNGSLSMLEQFLLSVGVDTDSGNCAERLSNKAAPGRGNLFADRHSQIYMALQKRCTELSTGDLQEQWQTFASTFNRQLAGRHPFALTGGSDTADAEMEDVGNMLKGLDRVARIGREVPAASGRRPNTGLYAAQRFVEQLEKVKGLLGPLYPTEEGAVAGFDLMVDFRVNQGNEIEGNKVIDWSIEVGSSTQRLRDPVKPLRWEPATPITLTLRLAKDSPITALTDGFQPYLSTDGKTLVFRFADTWSLLRMVQRLRDTDPARRGDARSQTLRLEFPYSQGGDSSRTSVQEQPRARVYLRMTVMPVGKRTPLAWPPAFPIRAPDYVFP